MRLKPACLLLPEIRARISKDSHCTIFEASYQRNLKEPNRDHRRGALCASSVLDCYNSRLDGLQISGKNLYNLVITRQLLPTMPDCENRRKPPGIYGKPAFLLVFDEFARYQSANLNSKEIPGVYFRGSGWSRTVTWGRLTYVNATLIRRAA
jgi:hypothetical protein